MYVHGPYACLVPLEDKAQGLEFQMAVDAGPLGKQPVQNHLF